MYGYGILEMCMLERALVSWLTLKQQKKVILGTIAIKLEVKKYYLAVLFVFLKDTSMLNKSSGRSSANVAFHIW